MTRCTLIKLSVGAVVSRARRQTAQAEKSQAKQCSQLDAMAIATATVPLRVVPGVTFHDASLRENGHAGLRLGPFTTIEQSALLKFQQVQGA